MAFLEQLRYFVVVAEERHFTRAADLLGIAQPGLSQQIKALEKTVGASLFIRDKRSVELTPAGEALLDDARMIVELSERALTAAQAAENGKRGLIKLGTRMLGSDDIFPAIVEEFSSNHPLVAVEYYPASVGTGVLNLKRRVVDVALILTSFEPPTDVNYVRIGDIEALVALPADHELASLDRIPRPRLVDEVILGPPRMANDSRFEGFFDQLFGGPPPRYVEVPDAAAYGRLQRVAAGEGVTVIANPSVLRLEIAGVVFRPFVEPVPLIEYGLAWLDRPVSPYVKPFVEIARKHLEARNEA